MGIWDLPDLAEFGEYRLSFFGHQWLWNEVSTEDATIVPYITRHKENRNCESGSWPLGGGFDGSEHLCPVCLIILWSEETGSVLLQSLHLCPPSSQARKWQIAQLYCPDSISKANQNGARRQGQTQEGKLGHAWAARLANTFWQN